MVDQADMIQKQAEDHPARRTGRLSEPFLMATCYGLILVFMCLLWGGYLVKLKAPLMTTVPGAWSNCEDLAQVNYSAYLSGHRCLQGCSVWSFNEAMGNNLYYFVLFRMFSPANILGAWLVDTFDYDVFQVFGLINFGMMFLGATGLFYYLKRILRYSLLLSFLGVVIYIFLPRCSYSYHFSNYGGILFFVPYCLISTHIFFSKPSWKSALLWTVVLSAPLYFGMINIYVNYLLFAGICTLFHIMSLANRRPVSRYVCISFGVFSAALLINSVVWGPMLEGMMSSTGQEYVTDHSSVFNPLELPFFLVRSFFGDNVVSRLTKDFLLRWTNVPPLQHLTAPWLLKLGSAPLVILLLGCFGILKNRTKQIVLFWIGAMIMYGTIYYLLKLFHSDRVIAGLDLFKVSKYQPRIAFPFFSILFVEGFRQFQRGRFPRLFKICLTVLVCSFVVATLLYLPIRSVAPDESLKQQLNTPYISYVVKFWGYLLEILSGGLFRLWRWQVYRGPRHLMTVCSGLLSVFAAVLLLVCLFAKKKPRSILNVLLIVSVLMAMGFTDYVRWGGITLAKEVYACDYFRPEDNELLARKLLDKDSQLHRMLYFDDLDALRRIFPDNPDYQHPDIPLEIQDSPFEIDSRRYQMRADIMGIPIPDGYLAMPTQERRAFYSKSSQFSISPLSYSLKWWIVDPFSPRLPQDTSTRYVISRYRLPYLKLLNEVPGQYWRYLYELDKPLSVFRLENVKENGEIQSARLALDGMTIKTKSNKSCRLCINMTLDSHWTAYVNSVKTTIEDVDGILPSITLPAGESLVVLKYVYTPLKLFGALSAVSLICSILLFKRFVGETL